MEFSLLILILKYSSIICVISFISLLLKLLAGKFELVKPVVEILVILNWFCVKVTFERLVIFELKLILFRAAAVSFVTSILNETIFYYFKTWLLF